MCSSEYTHQISPTACVLIELIWTGNCQGQGDIQQDNITSLTAPYICGTSSKGEALVENNLFI